MALIPILKNGREVLCDENLAKKYVADRPDIFQMPNGQGEPFLAEESLSEPVNESEAIPEAEPVNQNESLPVEKPLSEPGEESFKAYKREYLESISVADLKAICTERNVEFKGNASKISLIESLVQAGHAK